MSLWHHGQKVKCFDAIARPQVVEYLVSLLGVPTSTDGSVVGEDIWQSIVYQGSKQEFIINTQIIISTHVQVNHCEDLCLAREVTQTGAQGPARPARNSSSSCCVMASLVRRSAWSCDSRASAAQAACRIRTLLDLN